jgi:hypothetical protein
MTGDSVVDEVYAIRAQIVEECGYDLQHIDDRASEAAAKVSGLRYVTLDEMKRRKEGTTSGGSFKR